MNFIELYTQADWVIKATIILLSLLSVFSWSIIIEKFLYLKKVVASSNHMMQAFDHTQSLQFIITMPDSPMKNILKLGQTHFNAEIENRMLKQLEKESEDLYKKLGIIGAIASSAPFIGLFGTVWGIMNSLQVIGGNNNNQLNIVAPMIGEALFVTAIGFIVAIPASLLYNLLNQKIEQISNQWYGFIIHTSHVLSQH